MHSLVGYVYTVDNRSVLENTVQSTLLSLFCKNAYIVSGALNLGDKEEHLLKTEDSTKLQIAFNASVYKPVQIKEKRSLDSGKDHI